MHYFFHDFISKNNHPNKTLLKISRNKLIFAYTADKVEKVSSLYIINIWSESKHDICILNHRIRQESLNNQFKLSFN